MAAFQGAVLHHRQIAKGKHRPAELVRNRLLHPRVQHGGAPVQNHAPDVALRVQIQKAPNHRQHRMGSPPGIHHQHRRSIRGHCHGVGAGPGSHANAVVIAHNALDDGKAAAVLRQGETQGVFVKKLQIQVSAGHPQGRGVEHGVDVVRAALEGPQVLFPPFQRRQQAGDEGGLSAAAVGSRN